jgi:hypothetical protein
MLVENNNQAQNNNIIVPASVVSDAIAAFAADRASQRQHEMAMMASLITFTMTAGQRIISFAQEEAAQRRAAGTAELREENDRLRTVLAANGWQG